MPLTDRDKAILDFERMWWADAAQKAIAIRERFDLSSARYHELLGEILADPDAFASDPLVVRRLQRQLARRRTEPIEPRTVNDWPSP
jgi:hypothetical protein